MQLDGKNKTTKAKIFFQPRLRQAFGIGLLVTAVFLLPGRASAAPGDTCPDNSSVATKLTACVTDAAHAATDCPTSCAGGLVPPCFNSLQNAVNFGLKVIGVFVNTTENVILPGGIDFRIEECRNAKITAFNPALPVIDIPPGAGDGNPNNNSPNGTKKDVLINGLEVFGGSVGILVRNNSTELKAIRAENNTGEPIAGDLTQLLHSGLTLNVSSSFPGFPPTRAVDDNLNTSWFTASGNACNQGNCPFFEIIFPQDVTVSQLQMFGNREFSVGFDFFTGKFQMFDAISTVLFDSGVINLPAPDRDITLTTNVAKVRRVRFTATSDESVDPGFAELKVIGFTGEAASGAGIEVTGNSNTVDGSVAEANDIGIKVTGKNNTLTSNRALNNIFNGFEIGGTGNVVKVNTATSNSSDGFLVTGTSNTLQDNKANKNLDDGFQIGGTANKLKSNASNQGKDGGSSENVGAEYRLISPAVNQGGNKADNTSIPSSKKCPTFPAVGICE